MMLKFFTFLEILPVWRSRRLEAKKYRAAGGHSEFGGMRASVRLNQTPAAASAETFPDKPCETADADARQTTSWLGLRQSFSALGTAADPYLDTPRPAECA
ncbi:hypothetical protein [Agrobacterium burrii]|uniref:Uncharacterized protein n=1 Tax=Agrobacterium burrii TaxID=2815339 RepID=A0ABS3EM56_9HYPH|nr:hypothetical protein [Agrobacterium burrii]MBO0133085.1 hypothetical protein [Agrobacterium burrii]